MYRFSHPQKRRNASGCSLSCGLSCDDLSLSFTERMSKTRKGIIKCTYFLNSVSRSPSSHSQPRLSQHQLLSTGTSQAQRGISLGTEHCEFSVDVRRSEAVTLRQPVMPVFD